jgi:hypothetical protein
MISEFKIQSLCRTILLFGFLAGIPSGWAAVIPVGPEDDFKKIEAARAGDEVVIAPGVYRFRVHLTVKAPEDNPIVIRAQDPKNRPVWDFTGTLVEDAPGSYTAGDRGRGGWQVVNASNYRISGLVFKGCRTASFNSAGIRYYGTRGLLVKDCLFQENDNGITGGNKESEATVEFCEFDRNGNLNATGGPTHNLYIYGGVFSLRYSYVHDSVQAQNFHIRAKEALLEYNWFARARSYEGDLMSDDDFSGSGPFSQSMLLRGNVFLQNADPGNHSQIVVLFNDTGVQNLTMSLRMIQNTLIGNGGHATFAHLSNASGTHMTAEVSNNVIFGTTQPSLVEDAAHGSVAGTNNWLATGVAPGALTDSVFSSEPGFRNAGTADYVPVSGSVLIGQAAQSVAGLPDREYYRNEALVRLYRPRKTALDIGAFEHTTEGEGIGPYASQTPSSAVLMVR